MPQLAKADASIYPEQRQRALHLHRSDLPPDALRAIVMDCGTNNGIATILAAADGTASIYLSSGGGFIGGGQANHKIRNAALGAVQLAQTLLAAVSAATDAPLPPPGVVYFYFVTGKGTFRAETSEAQLRNGTVDLAPLGAAMQQIVTLYRLEYEQPQPRGQAKSGAATSPQNVNGPPPDRTATPAFWGKQDNFGRGVQGVCGVALLVIAVFLFAYVASQPYSTYRGGGDVAAIGCLVLGIRCLWYAFTGRNNVNMDDL